MAPPKTIFPEPAVKVRLLFPLMVLEKVTVPAPGPEETAVDPNNETGLVKEMGWLTVRRVPERKTAPPPLCEKAPAIELLDPPVKERFPVLVMATGPKFVVMRLPLSEKTAPVSEIPPIALVFKLPSEVIPVPADCVMDAALILEAVTFPAFVIVRAPSGVMPPTVLPKLRLPAFPRFSPKV